MCQTMIYPYFKWGTHHTLDMFAVCKVHVCSCKHTYALYCRHLLLNNTSWKKKWIGRLKNTRSWVPHKILSTRLETITDCWWSPTGSAFYYYIMFIFADFSLVFCIFLQCYTINYPLVALYFCHNIKLYCPSSIFPMLLYHFPSFQLPCAGWLY